VSVLTYNYAALLKHENEKKCHDNLEKSEMPCVEYRKENGKQVSKVTLHKTSTTSTSLLLGMNATMKRAANDDASSASVSDSWNHALSQLCYPLGFADDEQDDQLIRNVESGDYSPLCVDDEAASTWNQAVSLLCRTLEIDDDDKEEEEVWERMYWEAQFSPVCSCVDVDTLNDIVDESPDTVVQSD
jgi:hypothetical protein